MAKTDDQSDLSDADLIAAYVANVQRWQTTEHVGAKNRLMDHRMNVVAELKARSGGTLEPLRSLLRHDDPHVRHTAAIHFRTIDHAAFELTMRALAGRSDEIGQDAKYSLDIDAHFQKVGYPELEKRQPQEPKSLPPKVVWQSSNPPPEGMTAAAIEQFVFRRLPRRHRQPRSPAIPPGYRAMAAASAAGLVRSIISALGGKPHAPPNWSWPMANSEPMLFLGQINCEDLKNLPGADRLPSSGMLVFFGDHDAVMGCGYDDVAVFHWADVENLMPANPPVELTRVFPVCALLYRPLIDLPDPHSNAVQQLLTSKDDVSRYAEIIKTLRHYGIPDDLAYYCGFSKLLGWPSLVQWHDLDEAGDGINEDAPKLLLQLDKYSNGDDSEGWGPGGSLYFLIQDEDLRNRRFARCIFEMQFT